MTYFRAYELEEIQKITGKKIYVEVYEGNKCIASGSLEDVADYLDDYLFSEIRDDSAEDEEYPLYVELSTTLFEFRTSVYHYGDKIVEPIWKDYIELIMY